MTPKTFARVHRFNRAMELLRPATGPGSLAAVAYATGYADQAHFTREFHRLAGSAPMRFLATRANTPPG